MGMALALALVAAPPQADEPRILEAAAQLAAETQLQQTVQQGNRRAIQRIPHAAKVAMIAGGAAVMYFSAWNADQSPNTQLLGMVAGVGIVGLGVALML